MIEFLTRIIPYISGLYTLPWIIVGFIVNWILLLIFKQERVDPVMKKIGLIILFFFVPPLVFRIFLDTTLGMQELYFGILAFITVASMYAIVYFYAKYRIKKQNLSGMDKAIYFKTLLANQGRSAAFVGGAMLAIEGWQVLTGIFIAVTSIALFAFMPYLLSRMNNNEQTGTDRPNTMPWFLRLFPWYFLCFVIGGILIHKGAGISSADLGDIGIIIRFYTSLTLPFALYYVGSGVHPKDFKVSELRQLIGIDIGDRAHHWSCVRQIFILTSFVTPFFFLITIGSLALFSIIPASWFAVIFINTTLPITSTNMFLVPYGLDKRVTAHSITWSTLINVPIAVLLIWQLSIRL